MATIDERIAQLKRDVRRSCNDCGAGLCSRHQDEMSNAVLYPRKHLRRIEAQYSAVLSERRKAGE